MNNGQFSILLIDDEAVQRTSLSRFLSKRGFQVHTAANGPAGLEVAEKETIDLTITDYRMPGWTGLDTLKRLKKLNPEIEVVVLTAYGNVEDAVTIMKEGAYDYLTKPIDLDELLSVIKRVQKKEPLLSKTGNSKPSWRSDINSTRSFREVLQWRRYSAWLPAWPKLMPPF